MRPANVEGYDHAGWILLDYFDFIVHIFSPDARAFYALERLWGSAKQIPIAEPEPPSPKP
jgi:ribosome-associated protein